MKGGIIGVDNTPTTSVASGIWRLSEAYKYIEDAAWPVPAPPISLGLSDVLLTVSGETAQWTQQSIDISAYASCTVRFVAKYEAGSTYSSDIQLDAIVLGSNTYSFESSGDSFQTTTVNTSTYTGASWSTVVDGSTNPRWNRDSGGTPSSTTGLTTAASGTYYIYYEASGTVFNITSWVRSPEVVLGSTPGNLTFYEGREGNAIGTLSIYLDVTALPS